MVSGQFFISLLNPGIGLLLSAAFFLLWLNQRNRAYVAVAALSYLLMTVGFLIQDVGPVLPHDLHRIPANVCFLLAATTLASAILGRYDIAPPRRLMTIVVVAAMIGQCWFLLVTPDLGGRIYVISIALGIIALTIVVKLYPVEKPHLIDWLLFLTAFAAGLNFIVRPIAIAWLIGGYGSEGDFQQSIYWTTVQFTQAMVSIMVALCLMVAVAIDLIHEVKREANTDRLSGLLTRRGFEEEATALLNQSFALGQPVALAVADIDHFKAINDTYGHPVGDLVIALFGDVIRQKLPANAVAGRIGGEEFAILLSGTEVGAARNRAEQVMAAFQAGDALRLPPQLSLSVSIGLHVTSTEAGLYELLSCADAALYEAKHAGRNRISVFRQELAVIESQSAPSSGRRGTGGLLPSSRV